MLYLEGVNYLGKGEKQLGEGSKKILLKQVELEEFLEELLK